MPRALLIDLDETLVVEERVVVEAFRATAEAAASAHPTLDPATLALDARAHAEKLWWAFDEHPYGQRIGISSWEGLWCRFEGDDPSLAALRAWSPTYRRETWSGALHDQGLHDDDEQLAAKLGERFASERRARHATFPDAEPALKQLRRRYVLALVTNGASCLQREKLAASGLAGYFDAVVVSGDSEVGAAKPDASPFRRALRQLDATTSEAVMVGDSFGKDVEGALAAGLGAIWLNRDKRSEPPHAAERGVTEIATLAELPGGLEAWRASGR
jgi:putative hydrolase of the HAD superfamily